jgi:PadR family transcriptional regulator, regulatory protein PadR
MSVSTGPESHHSVDGQSHLFHDLLLGFVKIHVLHLASIEPIYGAGVASKLASHGYRWSGGRLYPLLHHLDAAGFLQREDRVVRGKARKYYLITPLGRRALADARRRAIGLVAETICTEEADGSAAGVPGHPRYDGDGRGPSGGPMTSARTTAHITAGKGTGT